MIWTFNSTKKITRSQKTNPEFKKQIPCFSVIAHILRSKESKKSLPLPYTTAILIEPILFNIFLFSLNDIPV
jgi:hypothetical protein